MEKQNIFFFFGARFSKQTVKIPDMGEREKMNWSDQKVEICIEGN